MPTQPAERRPSTPFPYTLDELREDLHHLIQPVVGLLRLDSIRDGDEQKRNASAERAERLNLALRLADLAVGDDVPLDGLRAARSRHGAGAFRADSAPASGPSNTDQEQP